MILLDQTVLVPHLEYCNTVFVGLVKVQSDRPEDATYYILLLLLKQKQRKYIRRNNKTSGSSPKTHLSQELYGLSPHTRE